ncbi:MAG: hypothetical protein BRD30_03940, partial [Bacteroidetes bacterium QH_2_63_10]
MRTRRFPLPLLLVATLLVAPCAQGQQPDTTQLPEIAPREIEIRGERQIALPSLERQPLTGFATPPQVPAVPADHEPYVGSYEQPLDDLPESLPVPETVSESMRPTAEPVRGVLEGGTGRYFRRFFEGRVGVPLSAAERLSLHGQYTGTESDPDDDVAEARLRLDSNQDAARSGAQVYGAAQRYALFGATTDTTQSPNREGLSRGGSVDIQNKGAIAAGAGLRYDYAKYTSELGPNGDEVAFTQQQVELGGSVTAPFSYRPHLDATYRRSWLGGDAPDETAFDLKAEGTLSFFRTDATSVEVGATVLAFDTPAQPASSTVGAASATFIAPSVRAEWRFAEDARLHLRNQPGLGDTSLDRLYTTNPYAQFAPSLRPTLETTNAEAGLTLTHGPVRIIAAAGYRYAPTYRVFDLAGSLQSDVDNLYRVGYDAARIVQGRGEVALQGIDGVQASLSVAVRDGILKSPDIDIPNFAAVTADAMLAVSFAGGDGFVEAHGHFEGPRDAGLESQDPRLDSYFSAD